MMDKRIVDAVFIVTAIVLLPMVGGSLYAYLAGQIPFSEYAAMWREPLALLLGYLLRGMNKEA